MKIKFFLLGTLCLSLMGCGGQKTEPETEAIPNLTEEGTLPRGDSDEKLDTAFQHFLNIIERDSLDLHSVMVLQHGKVVKEQWLSEGAPEKPHIMYSVSKTFTSTAIGLAISEGKLKIEDKLVDLFPEYAPAEPSENTKSITVKDLLTMDTGMEVDPLWTLSKDTTKNWIQGFMEQPVLHEPGTWYCYNNIASYTLSVIVQKVTGEKVVDYLQPRLFEPLHIDTPRWDEHDGINLGGWGLFVKTEDMAKLGQLLLQKGMWNGQQLLPEGWVDEASALHVACCPANTRPDEIEKNNYTEANCDYIYGYGYQMWRGRNNTFRADGLQGQFIIVIPDLDAVIITTAKVAENQNLLNAIWEGLYPGLE